MLTMTDLPERIRRRINFDGPIPTDPSRPLSTGCWLWTGGKYPAGYGRVWLDGVNRLVHQVVFEIATGERSDREMFLDHLCRVRPCCRPDHLELVTPLGNQLSAQRPTCSHGHEFTDENTYRPKGRPNVRVCRACNRKKTADYYARKAS